MVVEYFELIKNISNFNCYFIIHFIDHFMEHFIYHYFKIIANFYFNINLIRLIKVFKVI